MEKATKMIIWYDHDSDRRDYTGILLEAGEVKTKVPEEYLCGVYAFPGLEGPGSSEELERKIKEAQKKAEAEGEDISDWIWELYPDGVQEAAEVYKADGLVDMIVYCNTTSSVGNLLDFEEIAVPVHEYWDGSNWKEIWYSDDMTEAKVDVDFREKICLDSWDGSNWYFERNFAHAYVVPLVELDGEDTEDWLFVEYTDYQGNIPEAQIISADEARKYIGKYEA